MDARELLKDWPCEQLASAAGIFQSSAWRLSVVYDGAPSLLQKDAEGPTDVLPLMLTFDGEASVLGIADSSSYPDLHLLWARRNELPPEVLLALVEKECGALFQMLEDATKKLVAVKGLDGAEVHPDDRAFLLTCPDGSSLGFTLSISPSILERFGRLDNLDETNEEIRSLMRPVWAQYAQLEFSEAECERLSAGDCLVLPDDQPATWLTELPQDEGLRVCTREQGTVTFAQMADDDLPPIPPPCEVTVYRGAREVATGRFETLGLQQVVRLIQVAGPMF